MNLDFENYNYPLPTGGDWPPQNGKSLFDRNHSLDFFGCAAGWYYRTNMGSADQMYEDCTVGWQRMYCENPNGHYSMHLLERRRIYRDGKLLWEKPAEDISRYRRMHEIEKYRIFSWDPEKKEEYAPDNRYDTITEASEVARELSRSSNREYMVAHVFDYMSMY